MAFAASATHAYATALSTIPFAQGDVILTSKNDYVSNFIQFLSLKKRLGVEVICIQSLENGDIDLENLDSLIQEKKPTLVALTHVPTNSGLIQDVEKAGEICNKNDVFYLVVRQN